jgi:hypothetical protein
MDEQLLHARICKAAGEQIRGNEILATLVNRWPDNAKVLAALVSSLFASGEQRATQRADQGVRGENQRSLSRLLYRTFCVRDLSDNQMVRRR